MARSKERRGRRLKAFFVSRLTAERVSTWLFFTEKPHWRLPVRLHLYKKCYSAAALAAAATLLAGCTVHTSGSPDQQLRQQAAEDAKQVHHDMKAAGREAQQALHQAGRETRDVVAGARQGWRDSAPHTAGANAQVDVNHASLAELESLPGIDAGEARRIAAGRPYRHTRELETRRIVSRTQYERIAAQVEAQ